MFRASTFMMYSVSSELFIFSLAKKSFASLILAEAPWMSPACIRLFASSVSYLFPFLFHNSSNIICWQWAKSLYLTMMPSGSFLSEPSMKTASSDM